MLLHCADSKWFLQENFKRVITEKDESLSELKSELNELDVTRADEKVMHYFCSQDIPS